MAGDQAVDGGDCDPLGLGVCLDRHHPEVLHGHGAIQPRISKLESVNVRQPVLTDAWRIDQKSCHVENFTNDFGW
ncbi:Uncharacterised protein [Mycobacterium tuberculosis]|nr:Uncharacterised protein [Mycobacterium tuberculosis]COY51684.1 Uncharacterised protein [Mycobacterium tuberculosis]